MVDHKSISVIVAVESVLSQEALIEQLRCSDDVKSIEVVSTPMELLRNAQLARADAVILEADQATEMPGILTHVFDAYPRMLAIVLDRNSGCTVYRQQLERKRVDGVSVSDLVKVLAAADSDYWAGA